MTSQKLRILFFIETGGPGGAERVVLELLRGFRELGHNVSLSTLRTGWLTENAQKEGFSYYQIHSTQRFDVSLPFRLAQLSKLLHADILHTHLLDSNFYGALAARICGVKHIGTEHGDVHHLEPKKYLRFKLRVATGGSSIMTSVSEFSARRLRELGVKPESLRLVPNPVRDPIVKPDREDTRRELGVSSEWLWLHVGNLRRVKDQRTLIRGFAESYHSSSQAQKLVIVGDGAEREELERLIEELGVRSAVTLLGHRDEVDRFLRAGDGFILSSVSESMPMALLEAISYQLYPICSAVGGIPELLPREQLFQAQNFSELGALCTKAVSNPGLAKREAVQLHEKIMRARSRAIVFEKYLSLYLGTSA